MDYTPITTEKIREDLWVAKTIYLNIEVSIEGSSKEEAIRKMEMIMSKE